MKPRTPTYLRGFVVATLSAAAATLIGGAFGDTAVASAREWDIGAYDKCAATNPHTDPDKYLDHFHYCCIQSGGDWDASNGKCVAPAANTAGGVIPTDLPRHTLSPDPVIAPPGDSTQTFTPVP